MIRLIIPFCFLLITCCTTKSNNEKDELIKDDIKLYIYAINYNNQLYRKDKEKGKNVLDFCIKMIDTYKKDEIEYFDFVFTDCVNQDINIFLFSGAITGVGLDNEGNLVRLIKSHKINFHNIYTKKEITELINRLPYSGRSLIKR